MTKEEDAPSQLGRRPELQWIDKRLLTVDHTYQREIQGRRSQRLIEKIAAEFCWRHCHVLVVTKNETGTWCIIDGQHRHAAALRRPDIKDMPCFVVETESTAAAAQAFVKLNRDRAMPSAMSIFHAEAAAGDDFVIAVRDAAAAAGVEVLRSRTTMGDVLPNQTNAIAALKSIAKHHGTEILTETLKIIRASHPESGGMLRERVMYAVAEILGAGRATAETLTRALTSIDAANYELKTRERVIERGELISTAAVEIILGLCGADVLPPRPKALAASKAPAVRKPFQFDRSKAPSVKKAAPVEIRGDVPVRRFEQGTAVQVALRMLQRAGVTVEQCKQKGKGYEGNPIDRWRIGKREYDQRELIAFADQTASEKGLQPLKVPA